MAFLNCQRKTPSLTTGEYRIWSCESVAVSRCTSAPRSGHRAASDADSGQGYYSVCRTRLCHGLWTARRAWLSKYSGSRLCCTEARSLWSCPGTRLFHGLNSRRYSRRAPCHWGFLDFALKLVELIFKLFFFHLLACGIEPFVELGPFLVDIRVHGLFGLVDIVVVAEVYVDI